MSSTSLLASRAGGLTVEMVAEKVPTWFGAATRELWLVMHLRHVETFTVIFILKQGSLGDVFGDRAYCS